MYVCRSSTGRCPAPPSSGFVIEVIGREYALYLRKTETTMGAYTRWTRDAKFWRKRSSAERWLAERPDFPGRVTEVRLVEQRYTHQIIPMPLETA